MPRRWVRKAQTLYSDAGCASRQRSAERHLRRQVFRISEVCHDEKISLEDWLNRRDTRRDQLAWMLGLEPVRLRSDLEPQSTGQLQRDRFTVEKLVIQSLPGLLVTANFYLPRQSRGPWPCVIYLNGNWPSLDGAKTGFQDRYLWYPAHGFALLVLDPLQFGEIPWIHLGTNRLSMWHWLSLGYTPAGVEVWNAMRAIDWLETRPEIDATRIGVTGISGGGVMTQYLAALDERVKVADASCSTYTIADQICKRLVQGQCDCTFFPNVFGLDFPDILGLIAPRPLLILGGRKDPIFPPSGFRGAYRRVKRTYECCPETRLDGPRVRLVESGAGHTDPPHFLEETRRWMARWLGLADRLSDSDYRELTPLPSPPSVLRCVERPPARALNYGVHEAWICPSRPTMPASRRAWEERAAGLRDVLRTRVFGWVPDTPPPFAARKLIGSGGFAGTLARYEKWEIQTEAGLRVVLDLVQPSRSKQARGIVLCVRRAADQVWFPDLDELLPLLPEWVVAAVSPRLSERPLPTARYAEIERSAALLGRTLAAMWVWDVLRAAQWVREQAGNEQIPLIVYGKGDAALVGLIAGVMDEHVEQVVVSDLPTSFRMAPPLLTLWRDADVPEIAGIIAPRTLTFVPEILPAFEVTRGLFHLCGAADRLRVELSVAEAAMAGLNPHEGARA